MNIPSQSSLSSTDKKLIMLLAIKAPFASRLIALFIDYLVIISPSLLLSSQTFLPYDCSFLVPFLFGAVYFGLGNSRFFSGQTLGKKAFALRTISLSPADNALFPYPGLRSSLARYLALYGGPILIIELFKNFYRLNGLQAEPFLLNLHLMPLMAFFIGNFFLTIFDPFHYSLHDRFAGTLVIRASTENHFRFIEDEQAVLPSLLLKGWSKARLGLFAGTALGACLWYISLPVDPHIKSLESLRFVIEKRWPVRMLDISTDEDFLRLQLVPLDNAENTQLLSEKIEAFCHEQLPPLSSQLKVFFPGDDTTK